MKTVLIVEDDTDHQAIYRVYLLHFGYNVLVAGDGLTGLRMAREEGPHLILIDLAMPIMDGVEALAQLKSNPMTASIPVIAITANQDAALKERCLQLGCDGFLVKPVDPVEVRKVIETTIGPP